MTDFGGGDGRLAKMSILRSLIFNWTSLHFSHHRRVIAGQGHTSQATYHTVDDQGIDRPKYFTQKIKFWLSPCPFPDPPPIPMSAPRLSSLRPAGGGPHLLRLVRNASLGLPTTSKAGAIWAARCVFSAARSSQADAVPVDVS